MGRDDPSAAPLGSKGPSAPRRARGGGGRAGTVAVRLFLYDVALGGGTVAKRDDVVFVNG